MKYKVLLIDDQHLDESLSLFKDIASYHDIEIHSVGFHKQGIDLLKQDKLFEYQAVILDATGFKDQTDINKEVNNTGVRYSLKELELMSPNRLIPWFIYTGAPKNITSIEFEEEIKLYQEKIKFGREDLIYYTKTLHEQELLEDIKQTIDTNEDSKLIFKYQRVCEAIKVLGFDKDASDKLLEMFKGLESDCSANVIQDLYNPIRKMIEKLFKALADLSIIDPVLVSKLNINACSRLLANSNQEYPNSHIPVAPIIQEILKNLVFLTQDSSHSEGNLRLRVNDFYNLNQGMFLYKASVFNLFEILVYFSDFIKLNNNIKINESRWLEPLKESPELIEKTDYVIEIGFIEKIDEQLNAIFRIDRSPKTIWIPSFIVSKYNLKQGQHLSIAFTLKETLKYLVEEVKEIYN